MEDDDSFEGGLGNLEVRKQEKKVPYNQTKSKQTDKELLAD